MEKDDAALPQIPMNPIPRAAAHDGFSLFSEIPEKIGLEPFPGVQLPAQNATSDLLFLRAQFPFAPILPFPARAVSVALAANVAQDIDVPDGAVLGMFSGGGIYFVSRQGKASIPVAGNVGDSILAPENYLWYLGGVRQLSVISGSDITVGLSFWDAKNWPRR